MRYLIATFAIAAMLIGGSAFAQSAGTQAKPKTATASATVKPAAKTGAKKVHKHHKRHARHAGKAASTAAAAKK